MPKYIVNMLKLYKTPIIVEALSKKEARQKAALLGSEAGEYLNKEEPQQFYSYYRSEFWVIDEYYESNNDSIDSANNCKINNSETDITDLIGKEVKVLLKNTRPNSIQSIMAIYKDIVLLPDNRLDHLPMEPGEVWIVKIIGISKSKNCLFFKEIKPLSDEETELFIKGIKNEY